jgi:hypothetical protein
LRKLNLIGNRQQRIASSIIFLLLVSLSVSLISIGKVEAASLLSDGFESNNFNAWTGTSGTTSIQSTTKHDGTYAAKITTTTAYSDAYTYKFIGPQTTISAKTYIQFDTLQANWRALYFLGLRDNTNLDVADVLFLTTMELEH